MEPLVDFLARVIGTVPGVDSQRFIQGNALIGTPGFAVPARAGDHALNPHQRSEGTRAKVRAGRDMDARIEQGPERHAPLHQLGTVEVEFIGVVISVGSEERGHRVYRLDPAHEVIVDERAVGDFRAQILRGIQLEPALIGAEHHGDGDITVRVAVRADIGAEHALDPLVELILRLRDIPPVAIGPSGIGLAQCHRPFGERAIDVVLRCSTETQPFITEARTQFSRDHRLENPSTCFKRDTMLEIAVCPDLL